MARRFHGVLSLILFSAAVAVGFFSMIAESMTLGLVYLLAAVFSSLVVVYSFCAKCCAKASCGHVLPGMLAGKMPPRSGKYTTMDILGVVLPAAAIVLMPQTWLLKDLFLFAVFWVFVAAAGAEVLFFVCRGCANARCPLNRG